MKMNIKIYKDKLNCGVPIDNFFLWCFEVLKKDYGEVTLTNIFKLFGLMFDPSMEPYVTFKFHTKKGKQKLRLKDAAVTTPFVSAERRTTPIIND